jgi:hypothetical protein
MAIDDLANLPADKLAQLERSLASLGTLGELIHWGMSQSPSSVVIAVHVQDEFSHDVVMSFGDDGFLVFDTT